MPPADKHKRSKPGTLASAATPVPSAAAGVQESHSYAVVDLRLVKADGRFKRLVKLRNHSWANLEGTGDAATRCGPPPNPRRRRLARRVVGAVFYDYFILGFGFLGFLQHHKTIFNIFILDPGGRMGMGASVRPPLPEGALRVCGSHTRGRFWRVLAFLFWFDLTPILTPKVGPSNPPPPEEVGIPPGWVGGPPPPPWS